MSSISVIFCLIHGEQSKSAFSVRIDRAETVSMLRECIVAKNPTYFKGIDPRELSLWRVSILDGDEKVPFLTDSNELRPTWKISKAFLQGVPEGHIHIIAKAPWEKGMFLS